jgi:hypothetical protein
MSFVGEGAAPGDPDGGDVGSSAVLGIPVVALSEVTRAAPATVVVVVVTAARKTGEAADGTVLVGGAVAPTTPVVLE